MKHLKWILAILLMLVVVILIIQNHEAMSTQVIFKVNIGPLSIHYESPQMNLYNIVTIAFLFGVFVAGICGIVERFRLKREIRALVIASQEKDKELNSLRNLPITSDDVPSEYSNSI